MPLTDPQLDELARAFSDAWDLDTVRDFFSTNLEVDIENLAPNGSVTDRAKVAVEMLNTAWPPRDRELLRELREHGNAVLRQVATRLSTLGYFAPNGAEDEMQAILLGERPFVNRRELRDLLGDFITPSQYASRVVLVTGDAPNGKSYTWEFLKHLAWCRGAVPQRLALADSGYTPGQVVATALHRIGYRNAVAPAWIDDPQPTHVRPLVDHFMGLLPDLTDRYWLVIDDLNHPSVTGPVRDLAYALAAAVQEEQPSKLWLALLGYNEPIVDRSISARTDTPRFPERNCIADHLTQLAAAGPRPLEPGRAEHYAEQLIALHNPPTRENLELLTADIESMGYLLRQGRRPEEAPNG